MGAKSQSRSGSLQFWPRKRAERLLPSVNWLALDEKGLLGFIAYKAGMRTIIVKDLTPNSLTKNKKIAVPVTILEIPPFKIYSVRFYKNNIVMKEIIVDNSDKNLKKIIKLSKTSKLINFDSSKTESFGSARNSVEFRHAQKLEISDKTGKIEDVKDYDDVRVIIYSEVSKTGIKKTPDLAEIGLGGSLEEKINFIKNNIGKEIYASEIFKNLKLVDVRGLTKGKGLVGPVKRFGIGLKAHKSEKGVRRPGSLGPWHPHHVIFRVPMAGQLGMFTRVVYNSKVIEIGKISEKDINPKEGFKHFGKIKTEYLILRGSVQGPSKRQLLITSPLRKTKKQEKKIFESGELR